MKKLSQLLESINEIDSLLEIDFKDKESFQKYQAKHKMRPTTKVNIAGKDTTVGDETGNKPKDDKPEVGTKVKDGKIISSGFKEFVDDVKNMKGEYYLTGGDGMNLDGMKIKDGKMFDAKGKEMDDKDIEDVFYFNAYDEEGNIVGIDVKEKPKSDKPKSDKPKSEPKLKNDLVKGLKTGLNPSKDSGLIKQTLDKLGDYPELKDKIDNLVDYIDNNSVGASEEEIERIKEKENEVRNDIIKALSDKPKSEKPKSDKPKPIKLNSYAEKALSDIDYEFEPNEGIIDLIDKNDNIIRNKVVKNIKNTEDFNGYIRKLYAELEEMHYEDGTISQEELSTLGGLELSDETSSLSDVPQDELVSKVKQLGKFVDNIQYRSRLGEVKNENFDLRELSKITTRYNK